MMTGTVCISALILLFHGVHLLPVPLGSPDTLILVVEPGDDVTIWYHYNLTQPAYIYWFKHTDSSVPQQLQCQIYKKYYATSPCNVVIQNNHISMSVNSQNTSLTITAVNHTNTGLYYCGIWQSNIFFSNATHLQVRDQDGKPSKNSTEGVFFTLTVVFGAAIVILIIVLIIPKRRKHTDTGSTVTKDSNYADLQFSNKKIRKAGRHSEVVDPQVVYSTVRH
ncbi:uncharacterized protein LOC143510007 [Brachyhypopomus gauderio]|uniref:uncharacterized protein LOC143510007 n=1 Tax=Brachyhypopomus gauderio TaxID=698409 RepID=UPI0040436451